MTAVFAGRTCVLGCDVSKWQGGINFSVFNLDFVIYKATGGDGGLYVDSAFYTNANGFNTVEGAYHFASKAVYDPVAEADHFCNTLLNSSWANLPADKKLPPTLDWEPTGGKIPNSANWCLRFLKRVEERTGMRPLIYTAGWCNPIGTDADMAELRTYDFWLASYTQNPDNYPCAPWGTSWSAWQYMSTGSVSGIVGNCDMDAFEVGRFNAILKQVPPTPPQPQPSPPEEDIMASKEELQAIVDASTNEILAAVKASATVLPDSKWMGTNARENKVYIVIDEVKFHVPSATLIDTLNFLGFDNRGVQDAALDALPEQAWVGAGIA